MPSRVTLLGAVPGIAVTLASLVAACAGTTLLRGEPAQPGGHQVLFVGNSLTETNGLPMVLSDLAASVGDTIHVAKVTLSGAALGDHLSEGTAARTIRSRWSAR